jgi:hypothetical protein
MPKSLGEWVDHAVIKWWMSDQAHRLRHGGVWHRGEVGGWSACGKAWLAPSRIRNTVGWGRKHRNPWAVGSITDGRLCSACFSDEIPWLTHRLAKPSSAPIVYDGPLSSGRGSATFTDRKVPHIPSAEEIAERRLRTLFDVERLRELSTPDFGTEPSHARWDAEALLLIRTVISAIDNALKEAS